MKKYKKDIAISHPLGWLLSKKQKITSVGKDVENLEPLCPFGRNVKWPAAIENSTELHQKIKNTTTI